MPDEFKSYAEALAFLNSHDSFERTENSGKNEQFLKLERIESLLKALNKPQEAFPIIHIAGTVGKGSVAAMLSAIMLRAGYSVGKFTSPHLVNLRERIMLNDRMILEEEFVSCINMAREGVTLCGIRPTFFELLTALGFLYFRAKKVDIAVVEVGLGGRLDSTNVVIPELSLISLIDYDHMHILGNTLSEIAREKAGIFKKGVTAISAPQKREVVETLRQAARETGNELKVIGEDLEFQFRQGLSGSDQNYLINLKDNSWQLTDIKVPLVGRHQADNCALVVAAVACLNDLSSFTVSDSDLRQGLARTNHPGRLETIIRNDKADILIDGAHNESSIDALVNYLNLSGLNLPLVCVFGCNKTKDCRAMLQNLEPVVKNFIFTKASANPRAEEPEAMMGIFKTLDSDKKAEVVSDLSSAIATAETYCQSEETFCITGSLYIVGEVKSLRL
jgi:dihydrofolate synthase/folylpolyglutamate synthase